MRGVLCSAFTGPEEPRISEFEEPKPASDEILINVRAASGKLHGPPVGLGMLPDAAFDAVRAGHGGAGTVVAVGEKVTRFRPGDRVACCSWAGG